MTYTIHLNVKMRGVTRFVLRCQVNTAAFGDLLSFLKNRVMCGRFKTV